MFYNARRKYKPTKRRAIALPRRYPAPPKRMAPLDAQAPLAKIEKPGQGPVHQFTRVARFSDVTQTNTLDVQVGYSFQLSDLTSNIEFTTLYDQYRIDEIEIVLTPSISTLNASGPNNAIILSAVDFDDAATLSGINNYLQIDNVQQHRLGEQIVRRFKPQFAIAAFGGGVFSSYAQSQGWIDVASGTVQHYGFRVFLGQITGTLASNVYTVMAKYKISCRNVR